MNAIKTEKIHQKMKQLESENTILRQQVEIAKQQLIKLETLNGKQQIPIPGAKTAVTSSQPEVSNFTKSVEEQQPQSKPSKEKKVKKEKAAGGEVKTETPEAPIDVGRLDFRVGKIIDVSKHPDADSLYVEKIDCGEAVPRTVVSGLVKFIPIEEMQNRMVVVMCNLKPAKMRGVLSEAMVMCASSADKVEILAPPQSSIPGDLVHCEGFTRNPDVQLNPKKKIFETCAPDLKTNDSFVACFKGAALNVPGKGAVLAQTLKNCTVK